jgi:sugar lactone lactonase YvrE
MAPAGLLITLLAAAALHAHPAIGIVADAAGNIFYSDNVHVWRVSPDGKRSIAVRNVHTHELWLDAAGDLYGEHLWYEGERTNRWGHRVWKRSPSGSIVEVIPARQGFREDYGDFSFVRCADGWFYWTAREGSTTALKRARPVEPAAKFVDLGKMRPGWLGITPTCDLIFADRGVVHRVSPSGKTTALHTRPLGEVMGLWADEAGNVYAALPERRQAVRIAPDGTVSTAATSPAPWRPSGGLVTRGGDLWLLEFDAANRQRARRCVSAGQR